VEGAQANKNFPLKFVAFGSYFLSGRHCDGKLRDSLPFDSKKLLVTIMKAQFEHAHLGIIRGRISIFYRHSNVDELINLGQMGSSDGFILSLGNSRREGARGDVTDVGGQEQPSHSRLHVGSSCHLGRLDDLFEPFCLEMDKMKLFSQYSSNGFFHVEFGVL
jgi:hypothetical protein